MPSPAQDSKRAKLVVHPAHFGDRHRLFVLTAGFTANSSLEFYHFIKWLRQYGQVVVVDHPAKGFSLQTEAEQVRPYIESSRETYFIGLSLGARLATEVLDQLEGSPFRSRVKGVVAICGMNQPSDFNGPSPKLWPFMVWPLTSPSFNRSQAENVDKKNPGPPWQVELMPHHQAAIEYGFFFPAKGRRAQVRGISQLKPLVPGRYADIPMMYLATPDDQVLHLGPASAGWKAAFGDNGEVRWFEPGVVRHCSLNEHPLAWALDINLVLKDWDLPVSYNDFANLIPPSKQV